MSSSMTSPWIKPTVLMLLPTERGYENVEDAAARCRNKPVVVQVVSVVAARRMLEVSDQNHTVSVYLTDKCAKSIRGPLGALKNSIVKLEQWHMSTVAHCAGDQRLEGQGVIAIQCSSLRAFGCGDILLAGERSSWMLVLGIACCVT
jgi:hypothetical protein